MVCRLLIVPLVFSFGLLLAASSTPSACQNGNNVPVRTYSSPKKDCVVSWTIDCSSESIRFNITAASQGWLAIGFNQRAGMDGADILQFSVFPNGYVQVVDGHSKGEKAPTPDNLFAIREVVGYTNNHSHSSVAFTRNWITNDSADFQITDTPFFLLWAYTSSLRGFSEKHTDGKGGYGYIRVNLFTGMAGPPDPFIAHGSLMIFSWGYLVGGGILISRFLKNMGHLWYILHYGIMLFAGFTSLAAALLAFLMINMDLRFDWHQIIGLIVIVGSILQPILGVIANRLWKSTRSSTPIFPDKLHWWIGRFIGVLGLANIFLGFYTYNITDVAPWVLHGIWVATLFAIMIFAQLKYGDVHHNYGKPDDEKPAPPLVLLYVYGVLGVLFAVGIVSTLGVSQSNGVALYR